MRPLRRPDGGIMQYLAALLAATSLVASATAQAADAPVIAPAPDWVAPPPALPAPDKDNEAPVELLLSDQQVKVEKGRQIVYADVAMRIVTPQGLAAGNISLPWRPETDDLIVHRLIIHRGDQRIDVLGSGQTFTVLRREQNLESATLDGVLTANIQPEGLQVGDVLELAMTVSSSDPTMKGHVEQLAGDWNALPIGRARLKMQWPASLPVRLRASKDMPAAKPVRDGDTMRVDYALDKVEPLMPPKGAPARYAMGRFVELSDFASWAEMGALLAPLYDKASTLPASGPLRQELDRIAALSTDPTVRAQAALALVQDRVRYVALAMGTGGLVPADSDLTWSRRYGDCKGKTALLLGLLHGLGIAADAVAVNAISGDGIDQRLPMVGLFNHVLVRATIAGKTYWLDGTRTGDTSLDRLRTPYFSWGLPLLAKNAALVRIMPPPSESPDTTTIVNIDARAGLAVPAPFTVETVLRGDAAISTRTTLANLTGAARDEALRRYWKGRYDFVEPAKTSASFDPDSGEQKLTMEGLARMDWKDGWYETDGMRVGYKADFTREASQDQSAPFAVSYPYYGRSSEKILLPPGFSGKGGADNANVDETVAGIEYKRSATLKDDVFLIEMSERSVAPEFPASEAKAAEAALRRLADETVYLRKPNDYHPTDKDVEVMVAQTPDNAKGYFERGRALMDRGRFGDATADFTKAHELSPKDSWTLANRAICLIWTGDYAAAEADLDALAAIDPKNMLLLRARGLMAERKGQWADAVASYDKAMEVGDKDSFTIGHRAIAQRALGNMDAALADAEAAIALNPRWIDLYMMRASIFRARGDHDAGLKEAVTLEQKRANDAYAHVAAASIFKSLGKWDMALGAYDRAIAIKPEGYIYLNRGQRRPKSEVAARRADFDEAVRLDPDLKEAWAAKADLELEQGDMKAATDSYSKAIAKFPDSVDLLAGRGLAHDKAGEGALAEKDFADARAKASEPVLLNNLCWKKATAGRALESALRDCDAALKVMVDFPPYLDSRALVLLQLGRLDEAIGDYDKVLKQEGAIASSLYGRALARSRKGDAVKAAEDRAAALKLNSEVAAEFEGYGLAWTDAPG